ncbi:MAG: hypothetical protein ACI9JU_003118, partial [Pseudohongiellaceae bacterium]
LRQLNLFALYPQNFARFFNKLEPEIVDPD